MRGLLLLVPLFVGLMASAVETMYAGFVRPTAFSSYVAEDALQSSGLMGHVRLGVRRGGFGQK